MLRQWVSTSGSNFRRAISTSVRCGIMEAENLTPDLGASDKVHPEYRNTRGVPLYEGDRKEHTGLVGLDAIPDARKVLIGLYNQTLRSVKDIPETAVYRQEVEKFTTARLQVLKESDLSDKQAEMKIMYGQLEELILYAKEELELMDKMKEWKPWEAEAMPEFFTISNKSGRFLRGGAPEQDFQDGEPVHGVGQRHFD